MGKAVAHDIDARAVEGGTETSQAFESEPEDPEDETVMTLATARSSRERLRISADPSAAEYESWASACPSVADPRARVGAKQERRLLAVLLTALNGKRWPLMRVNENRSSVFPQVTGNFGKRCNVSRRQD
jgi:hypothetical protein